MMKNFRKASYNIARTIVLVVVWLSVAPVLAGSYGSFHHSVRQPIEPGHSVVYKSENVTVAYKSAISTSATADVIDGQVVDYF